MVADYGAFWVERELSLITDRPAIVEFPPDFPNTRSNGVPPTAERLVNLLTEVGSIPQTIRATSTVGRPNARNKMCSAGPAAE
jgi:hypothetical protein